MAAAAHTNANHPNADHSVTFKGLAAFSPNKEGVKDWSYNPPKLADDFVDIKISHCGICGSDLHSMDSGWGPANYPFIPGHEIIGTIVAKGSKVTNVNVGDRVGVGAQCGACMDCYECKEGCENHCRAKLIWTYNTKYPDGQVSQGGYAERVRCQADFAFKIPEAISSAEAAPLMCAGVTVYAPLARSIKKQGMKVAIVGIGGLGHLGVKFAVELQKALGGGVDVTAISHHSRKKEETLAMGATSFIDTSDKASVQAAFRKFDYVLATANGSDMAIASWLTMIKLDGTFCSVGLPEEPVKLHIFSLLGAQVNFTASGIGSTGEIKDMLAFAAKHNVRPIIEKFPMAEANKGIQRVRDNAVRFRVVLENPQ